MSLSAPGLASLLLHLALVPVGNGAIGGILIVGVRRWWRGAEVEDCQPRRNEWHYLWTVCRHDKETWQHLRRAWYWHGATAALSLVVLAHAHHWWTADFPTKAWWSSVLDVVGVLGSPLALVLAVRYARQDFRDTAWLAERDMTASQVDAIAAQEEARTLDVHTTEVETRTPSPRRL